MVTVRLSSTGRIVILKIANAAPDGLILGAIRAGKRVLTVGDRGVILLSDDQGTTWRQAQQVPTRATLTVIFVADEKTLWAVGHWGVILKSVDGGEYFTVNNPVDSRSFAASVVNDKGQLILFTDHGIVKNRWFGWLV